MKIYHLIDIASMPGDIVIYSSTDKGFIEECAMDYFNECAYEEFFWYMELGKELIQSVQEAYWAIEEYFNMYISIEESELC